ncbi:MAG: leucine/isoleucine/valine transporter permease subunit [Chloroflexi bacterium]|nr:leucine/isoleucine/valine transporter permease subunit [Chloroflexota bacterium]
MKKTFTTKEIINKGLLAGAVVLSLSVIGFIALLAERELIKGWFSLGHIFLVASPFAFAYVTTRDMEYEGNAKPLQTGFIIGAVASIPLIVLSFLAVAIDIRQFLSNVSPALIELLTFGQTPVLGSILLLLLFGIIGVFAASFNIIPENIRHPLVNALVWTLGIATFSEILLSRVRSLLGRGLVKVIFSGKSLNPIFAIVFFAAVFGFTIWWDKRGDSFKEKLENLAPAKRKQLSQGQSILLMLVILFLPLILGSYLTEVANNVGIYILMGLGLNIVVGFAGLLDLGYVAFFAIGAYVMGVLTSEGALGLDAGFSFWTALPISVIVATLFGIVLGIPVLGMRGDYLAIVTLGFGEIIRVVAVSDLFKDTLGGAQGILQIPKPEFFGIELVQPGELYYVVLAGVLLAVFIATRLRDSRLGRQWMALREDEDVAEAMGMNLVSTKLMAFATGAAFSGLSGAIFASKLTSIFPHSFNLLISINVLSLIIVGGVGSIPGVFVGALVLVGLPELLREFAEYRLLIYGVLLIVMMLVKPEGLLPDQRKKRELKSEAELDWAEK